MSGKTGIEIRFSTLRPGEKLHEELFGDCETVKPTGHHLVRAVDVPPMRRGDVSPVVDWDAALSGVSQA
ncbi:MAG: polysaccharide biosynthesis protein, partial [Gammaproteobacteria bacterium]|nr:polysaccharide biosynthesis protein [Gammaproteobacteria bacterium]